MALARGKAELRRERDRLLLSLGEQRVAEAFGLAPAASARVLADARRRIDESASGQGRDEITVRRLRERQAVGLSVASADRDPAAPEGSAPRLAGRSARITGPGGSTASGKRRPAEPASERWALADAHYATLGSASPTL